ncbi:hypothetical protein [Bacillus thuringiensis]|uniref:hypothetical protein n=1 Tax=Bacillus thuringiensis TaxID=1428 RepID=UPI0011A3D678|nr:hypothetical protein [Bacillus thuringiensis]
MNIEVVINEVPLTVVADFEGIKNDLELKKVEVQEAEELFMKLHEVDEYATREESLRDVEQMLKFVNSLEHNEDALIEHVRDVRKKKNGKFWLNSGTTLSRLECVTEYFTDYTNAWSTPQLRLEVIDADTCELVFRNRTETL